jgi:hypothetical protein
MGDLGRVRAAGGVPGWRPVTREDASVKARRLLGEGRVTIRFVGDDRIWASVRGDTAEVYAVEWTPEGWWCSCPAASRCSHVRAVQLVTLISSAPRSTLGVGTAQRAAQSPERTVKEVYQRG